MSERDSVTPDINQILQQITQNPEAMQKAMQLATDLGLSQLLSPQPESPAQTYDSVTEQEFSVQENDISRSNDGNGGASLIQNPPKGDRVALLRALKPFLSAERQQKADAMIRLIGLMSVASNMGLTDQLSSILHVGSDLKTESGR